VEKLKSEDVARRIEICMVLSGVRSVTELHRLTGLNRSTLSLKLSGVRKWQIEDLQIIATRLRTSLAYLMGETDNPKPVIGRRGDAAEVAVPLVELKRRLDFVGIGVREVVCDARACPGTAEADLKVEALELLLPRQRLEALAFKHGLPVEYLLGYGDPAGTDRIEAQLQFSRAAAAAGVEGISLRDFASLTAEQYRVLARAIERGLAAGPAADLEGEG